MDHAPHLNQGASQAANRMGRPATRQTAAHVRLLVRRGSPGPEIVAELQRQGIEAAAAWKIVRSEISAIRQRAALFLGAGVAMIAVGLIVTVVSYTSVKSNPTGGMFVIYFGPVIAGSVSAIVGIIQMLKRR